jgi:YhcH/YjgK/YiaL family protein
MILDNLENADRYYDCAEGLEKAFKFLTDNDLENLPPCKIKIQGDDIYVVIADVEGKEQQECRLEAHRDYIDIQLVINGTEQLGWSATEDCKDVIKEYNEQHDVEVYADQPDTLLTLTEGKFVIFFPEDAHMPSIAPGQRYRKVVAKVKA